MPRSLHIQFRAGPKIASRLTGRRCQPGAIAARDLARYYAALDYALATATLSEAEWNYLRDILNGAFVDERTADYLWAEVADAEPETAAKWRIDAESLSRRLREFPQLTRLAICDAVDRWWDAQQ